MPTLTFKEAARVVLEKAGEPLSSKDIAQRALEQSLIVTEGQTPDASIGAQLAVDISRKGAESAFMRTAPGVFALRSWLGKKSLEEYASPAEEGARVRVPFFPFYSQVAGLLEALDGTPRADFLALKGEVYEQRGSPQDPVDWSDPDAWIPARLSGRSAELARQIWAQSNRVVNPRHMSGAWFLASRYELVATDAEGILRCTTKGQSFVAERNGAVAQEIDVEEGLERVLLLVADLGPAKRADLLPPFADFAREVSNLRAESTIQSFLWARLSNLIERDLIERVGRSYSITKQGLSWLASIGAAGDGQEDRGADLLELIRQRGEQVRTEIADRLSRMDPFAFEHLVKTLLEAMDYEDVSVTAKSGDGGVDVTARIQLGISDVVEVVQVKRHAKPIQRAVLDALRGSLHRFHAVRGTIITTGKFAKGTAAAAFEAGAAPITLIDGEKLINLMLEHGIGVHKRRVELLEVEPSAFSDSVDDLVEE